MKNILEYLYNRKGAIKNKTENDLYIIMPGASSINWFEAESRREKVYRDAMITYYNSVYNYHMWILSRGQIIYLSKWKGRVFLTNSVFRKIYQTTNVKDAKNIINDTIKAGNFDNTYPTIDLDSILDFQYK